MNPHDFDPDEDERGFFARHRVVVSLGAVALVGAGVYGVKNFSGGASAPPRKEAIVFVSPPPPPPPPPPQQPPPPPPEQKMIEQTPVNEPEDKPDAKPADEPPPDVATGVQGPGGPDGFGLGSRSGSGPRIGGGGGRPASRWGWYAGKVQAKIQDAVRSNRRTRNASMRVEVRIWSDQTGRVTRAQVSGSTGDSAVDEALRNEVLTGMQLPEAPPQGMPMPIVLRLTARRPN